MENNEMMVAKNTDIASANELDHLKNADNNFFCSIPNDGSRKAAIAIYNAINNKGMALDDHKNEVLSIVDVAAHPVTLVDENTGEVIKALRTVLITSDGRIFDAVSQGVASSLSRIFSVVGMPPYSDEPLKIKVVEQKTRKGYKTNVIELV